MSEGRDPLVIRRLDYLGPMSSPDGWRPEAKLPEVAFSGRSNVGKSSLINKLVRRKGWARVSNTPGRTREIHFFDVNGQFALVDLPGYGYARISKTRQAEWRPLIEGFLRSSPKLQGVVQLLDVRHDPTEDDLQMLDFLSELEVPTIIVATKIDKMKKSEARARVLATAAALGMDEAQIIPFSAVTGEGRDDLAAAIAELIAQPAWREPEAEPPAIETADGQDAAAASDEPRAEEEAP
ncbi:MAG: ribosome biogenesis GTP-binding protein YihA/YsxC [Gemmatirosa sp.]